MQTILLKAIVAILFLLSSLSITADTEPFSFTAIKDASPNTLITSNIATITGFDSTISIRIEGGSYTIGNSVPTADKGIITSGATVALQILSSSELNTQTVATLTVGSGASSTRAIFSVTTRPALSTPVFTSTPITTVRVDSLYQYNLSASDDDGSNLVFSASPSTELPSWLTIDVIVTTLAGDGVQGSDDGATNTARFSTPSGVAIDAIGNIIVADQSNHRIRSISLDGVVRTVAGSGDVGDTDGASATAKFDSPKGMAIDASGNIVVADVFNNRIRSISASGVVSTIAGSGDFGAIDGASTTASFNFPSAVAIDSSGNIIVADRVNHRIRSISTGSVVSTIAGSGIQGFANGASATAEFSSPSGVAIDAFGNIIVADTDNHRIRSISASGLVSTIAGSGTFSFADGASATARFNLPEGVAIDTSGNIIVVDNRNHRIRSITPDGIVATIAGSSQSFADGVGSNARFNVPSGVAIDASGNIIVTDSNNNRIRKIYRNSLVGTPSCSDIGMHNLALIVSDGELQDLQSFDIIVADDGSCGLIPTNLALSNTNVIENIATNSIIATISADDSDNPASLSFSIVGGRDSASFSISADNQLVIDHSPDFEAQNSYEIIIAVSDTIHQLIKTFNISVNNVNEFVPIFTSVPITSVRVGSLYQYDLGASDDDGSNLVFSALPSTELPSWLVIDTIVSTLAGEGSAGSDDGVTSTASFNSVDGIAIDASGNIIVADGNNHRIRKISPEGIVSTIAGGGRTGVLGGDFADGASATARFSSPRNVAIDASGNIIVADGNNRRIRSISPEGIVSTIAGSGSRDFADGASATAKFDFPSGIAIDASGNIIITDGGNNRIRSISSDGTVTTIAGSGDDGFADGASATAKFDFPTGIAIDASGNIIVADFSNHRIRSISTDGTVTTIAGSGGGFVDGASATAKFSLPRDVAIDASGNIIVVDSNNHSIRNISPEGIVSTIAGNGQAGGNDGPSSQDKFSFPSNVAIDASGNIIITSGNRIRKINRNSFTVAGIAGCDDIGVHSLALIVSDGELQSSQSFDIAVVDDISCDVAPTDLRLSVTTIVEGIAANSVIATISATASNALGPFEFSIVDGRDSASFSIINDNQLVIDHSPSVETQSNYEIIIGVSDNLHLATKSFKIMVVGIESVPVFTSEPITAIKVNSPYQYSLRASDAEGGRFVFDAASGTVLPSWLDINTDIVVTTIAGSSRGFANGASATAKFFEPRGVVIDALGNIIVADRDNNRIRSISTEGTVTTIAGGSAGFVDGASATAKFRRPQGVAIDTSGNIIVADEENHRIRKIAPNGMVTTIAGGGSTGSFGGAFADGASATARFSFPADVAIDAAGNIIVADHGNNRIRGISTDGIVFTIAGRFNGFADGIRDEASFDFPRGVDIDAAGNIIVTDSSNSSIRSISPEGRVRTIAGREDRGLVNGIGTAARFTLPDRAAIDSFGNIIVADALNHRIRNVATNRAVTTIAGSGPIGLTASNFADGAGTTARFNEPRGVAIDASGNIIIADALNDRIRKIDRTKVMLAGTPSCDDIDIHSLELMVSDSMLTNSQSFNVVVADDGSCGVIPTNLALSVTTIVEGIAANSVIATISATASNALSPFEFSIVGGRDSARFSISDVNKLVIDHSPDFGTQSSYEIIIGVSDTLHLATKSFEISVVGIESVPVFISTPIITTRVNSIYQYNLDVSDADSTNFVFSAAPSTELPSWLAIDVVVNTLAGNGLVGSDNGATNTARFNSPIGVAIDALGNIVVADANNDLIRGISSAGIVSTIAGGSRGFADGASATAEFDFPTGVAIDASGNIIVADVFNNRIRSISASGVVSTVAGSGAAGAIDGASDTASFDSPSAVAIDSIGNIIVADRANHRIRSISTGGIVSTIAGSSDGFANGASATAEFSSPSGVAIDAFGNIIVADTDNHLIRSISTGGIVSTIAGSGTSGFADGASATAGFNLSEGVAIDTSGNIIVADNRNYRIRSITLDGIVATIAGSSQGFADGSGSNAQFDIPFGVAIDTSGNIIIADSNNNRIREIDRNSFAVAGVAGCGDIGIHNLELVVSDGAFQDLQSFDITVADDGSCGVAPVSLTLSTTNIVENILADSIIATISATATNPLDVFEFSIVGGRDSASFSISNGNQLAIDHSPNFDTQSSYEIIISVSDTLHLATKSFMINVVEIERVPVFTSTPITTVRVGSLYQYRLSASDADSSNLVFSASPSTELPDWLAVDIVVTTLAGTSSSGDNDGATNTARFATPRGIVIDASGNIIITDDNNHNIRRISTEGIVSTIAGTGGFGFNNGASATAMFESPWGIVIDASGNIIIADLFNSRIRGITTDGTVTTIAGSGVPRFADGASATAQFRQPSGVVIDASGSIIVTDSFNSRIRKITPNGVVTTIAGSGIRGFVDGASATAQFNFPRGVAIDAGGNIIVADQNNHRIRSISTGGIVTTIAGSGTSGFADGASATAGFSLPRGVAIDAGGNIIVADQNNHRIRSISAGGIVSTIAGSTNGFADIIGSNAKFSSPSDIAINNNDIIVADSGNRRIRKIDRDNLVGIPLGCDDISVYNLELIVSDGEFQSSQSFDLAVVDDGSCGAIPTNLALSVTNAIENTATNSIIATISADDSDNPASLSFSIVGGRDSASFSISANQLVIDHSPNFDTQSSYEIIISVSDTLHIATKSFTINVVEIERVPVFTSTPITTARVGSLYRYDLSASDADSSNLVFSAALGTELPNWLAFDIFDIVVTTLAGQDLVGNVDGVSSTASFNNPSRVAIDASGNIIVADTDNHRIRSISIGGMVSTIAGSGIQGSDNGASATAKFSGPIGVAIDASGNIIVADTGNHRIRSISAKGVVTTIAGSSQGFTNGASATAEFSIPRGVAIDASGNIIVADAGNHSIRSISPNGVVSTIAGSGDGDFADGASATARFSVPRDVAIDASGNIIVADSINRRIRSISLSGTVTTIAGSGISGSDDGASATAKFGSLSDVAIDASGNIIVADRNNQRIRKISPEGIVSTIAGSGGRGFANGTGDTAKFDFPMGIAIDSGGNIIVADSDNNRIRKINRNNVILIGTSPSCDDIGIHNLELIVSDGELQSSQSFDITVADNGSCDAIPTNLALSTTNIIENIATHSIIATISADDSDNPASLSFSVIGGEDSASFSVSGGNQLVIDHSPDFETQNSYEIIIAVSDTIHQLTKTFHISVNDANEAVPIFTSTPITSARVNSLYRYNLDASDADSSNLVFRAASGTELPNWLAIDSFVTTLAGKDLTGSDDGTTITASFNSPIGIAIDASGDIIIADTNNHRIRRITPGGVVTTIAGAGPTGDTSGSFADGASATARFDLPRGVAIDALGNIIVADVGNHRIRNIAPDGMVTTIAGSETGFADGASATARFNNPVGVVVDASGDIIIADTNNHRIRRISAGGTVTTIAGSETGFADGTSTTAMFFAPTGVAIDALGNIIVADFVNHRIRSISTNGVVTTIAGSETGSADGASATARFSNPSSVAIDALGNIIVADVSNHRIRNIAPDGMVTTIAGSSRDFADGIGSSAQFSDPSGVVIDTSGDIIIVDSFNHRIRKIDRSNLVSTSPSCDDIGIYNLELIVSDGELQSSQSFDITVTDDGSCGAIPTNLTLSTTTIVEGILANSIISTISADDSDNSASLTFNIIGGEDGASFSISGVNQLVIDHSPDFDAQRSYEIIISVSDTLHIATKSFRISVINIEGVPVFTSVPITNARVNSLYQYSLSAGDADSSNLVFSVATGTTLPNWLAIDTVVTTLAGDGSAGDNNGVSATARFRLPRGIAIDTSGNIIVADQGNSVIRSIAPDGMVSTIAGGSVGFADGASATAKFDLPTGVAIDADGNIIVADGGNNSIRKITPDGIVSTIAGSSTIGSTDGASITARFNNPAGIVIDASGNIIVADNVNNRIRSITLDGTVTTIAGGGVGSTDGASATARFELPTDVAIDASGNIIVADSNNHRIRSITLDGTVTTIAGSIIGFVDGTSSEAKFWIPTAVAIDASGNIIVADNRNHRIRSIAPDRTVSTIAGSGEGFIDGAAGNAKFNRPFNIAIDAGGNIIVADNLNHSIRKIDRNNIALVGTPLSCSDIGSYDLVLVVSDGESQSSQTFTIMVMNDGSCLVAPFSFNAVSGVTPGATVSSNAIIVATNTQDPQSTFTIRIEGSDGRYSINDGSYTGASGVVNVGDSVKVQIVASKQLNTTKTATVTIHNTVAAFTITTANFIIIGGDSTTSYNNIPITISATSSGSSVVPITWTSSATNVVSFSDPNIGLITIVGAGTALITAIRGDDETSIIFTVDPLTLTPVFIGQSTFVYNTSVRTVLATITSGIVGVDDVSLSVSGATATDVGNYNIDLALIGADSGNYLLSTTTFSWSIIKADQSQFSLGADTTITFGISFSRPATGVSATVASSYGSSNPSVATVDTNGNITTTGVGSTIISATNTGDNNYNSAADSYTLNVAPLTLTIATSSTTTIYTGAAITITTTITNLVSGHEQVSLTISGDQTATNTGAYSFDISAIEGSDSPNYILIPTTISWTITPAEQSELDVTGNATRLMVGQIITATATNNQPQGTLTIISSEAGIVAINGNTITAINVGITTITITKQVANYNSISTSYQLVVIQNTTTAIDAGNDRTATYTLGGTLSAQVPTNIQGRVISYAVNPIGSDVATVNINTGAITITNAGTVNIVVSAAATTNVATLTDIYLLTINQANQDPFTITASDTLTFGATNAIAIVDPGSGDGTITYESNNIAIATITNNGIITATGVGEAIITATRDGGRNYLNTSATHSLIVERANQANFVISGSSTLTNAQTSFVTATGGSGTGTISFSSSNPDIATISQSGVITAQSLGTTTISATKSGGDNYRDISDSYLLTIINTTPTVTNLIPNQIASLGNLFTLIIPANTFNDANGDTLTISVSALPPSLTFDGINSITGIPATVGVSDITVTADDGNGAMVSTSFSLTVSDDFIIVGNNPRNVVYGAASQNIIAQGGLNPTGTITFSSSTPSIANFGDTNIRVLTISSAGTAIITATREGTGEQASISLIVSPRTITPTFAGSQTFIYNTNIRTVLATITSGIVGTDDVSLAISGATATDVGNYNIGLALTGASSLNYLLSTTTLSWSIIKANQTEFTIMISSALALGATTIATASGGQGTGVVSFASSNPTIAIISQDGLITAQNLGTTTITATKAGDSNYNDISTSTLLEVIPRFNLDIDGDGSRLTTTDGILILRYLTDPRTFTTTGATTTNATMDAQTIENSLEAAYQNNILDVDNSGTTEASSDGMLIMRYLADQENLNTTGATTTTSTDIDTITLNLQRIY